MTRLHPMRRLRRPKLRLRRPRTRREALARRVDDVAGQVSWSLTRWYGRQVKGQLPPRALRWSAIAGGAGMTAGVAGLVRHRTRSRERGAAAA